MASSKAPTILQQLLEEINFQRTKELRQLHREDGGFVVLQGTTYWTDLFVRHFLFQSEPQHTIDSDDLLFFVRKKHVKGSSRHMPKFDTEVDVFRKDSRKLPIGDPDVDWEETVYLNLIIHQFDYTLTLAICTRTSPKELQVLRRHSQRVYASPSRRKMDTKGDSEEITYPHICFMVDNFDEVFSDILVRDGEMVCVELVASDRDGSIQGVIFLGSIRYDALKKVYDSRQSSLSTKVAQRMTFGLWSTGGPQTRCEFVRMKGPQGKGHAEMAVTKPKGSGVETPTSEPGFSASDMWDDEWDEDPDDFYNYRHQRRLSDPSASLTNFSRYAFRTKGGPNVSAGAKARSENEGLDSLASEVSEIEAGDLRDDRPASSASETNLTKPSITPTSTTCCNCFRKRWSDTTSTQMSDIYCRTCDEANSPACLTNITPKRNKSKNKNILNVESEIEIPKIGSCRLKDTNGSQTTAFVHTTKANKHLEQGVNVLKQIKHEKTFKFKNNQKNNNKKEKKNNCDEEYELADDATSLNETSLLSKNPVKIKMGILHEQDSKRIVTVQGKEELAETNLNFDNNKDSKNKLISNKYDHLSHSESTNIIKINKDPQDSNKEMDVKESRQYNLLKFLSNDLNGNLRTSNRTLTRSSTLPKRSRKLNSNIKWYNRPMTIPSRLTTDGTKIYYWCELSKKIEKELDDGSYNPLWATKGFTQTFHFWKEHRRQQSIPLNAFLTYVTLPWWSIAKDLLDHRETPILTF